MLRYKRRRCERIGRRPSERGGLQGDSCAAGSHCNISEVGRGEGTAEGMVAGRAWGEREGEAKAEGDDPTGETNIIADKHTPLGG